MLSLRGFFGSAALLFYFLSIEGMTLGDSQILSQLAAFFHVYSFTDLSKRKTA